MPVHYGSKELNNVTVSSPLSKEYFLYKQLKSHRLQVQDMLSESIMNKRSLPATLEKVLPVKEISLLLSTLLPLSSARLSSSAETTNTPFQLQLKTNTLQMVSFQGPFQWVLPVPELTVMMLWHAGKRPEEHASIF